MIALPIMAALTQVDRRLGGAWRRFMGIPQRGARIATRRTKEERRHQLWEFALSFVLSACIG